jgi:hypothetical protein
VALCGRAGTRPRPQLGWWAQDCDFQSAEQETEGPQKAGTAPSLHETPQTQLYLEFVTYSRAEKLLPFSLFC